mgnify:CR=1 FL=1
MVTQTGDSPEQIFVDLIDAEFVQFQQMSQHLAGQCNLPPDIALGIIWGFLLDHVEELAMRCVQSQYHKKEEFARQLYERAQKILAA